MRGKVKKNYENPIWLIVALLVIFLMITFSLLGDILGNYAKEQTVITLKPEKSSNFINKLLYKQADLIVQANIYDRDYAWDTSTNISLFHSSYANTNKETVVRNKQGNNSIAPGTKDTYEFTIYNSGNIPLEYSLDIRDYVDVANIKIPLKFRLRKNKEWILGDKETWTSIESIPKYSFYLNSQTKDSYLLEWKWPFEEDNKSDTELGILSNTQDLQYQLSIKVVFQEVLGMQASDINGNFLYKQRISIKNLLLCLIDGITLCTILLLAFSKKRVYVTGFLNESTKFLYLDKKQVVISQNGRFLFGKIKLKTHQLKVNDQIIDLSIKRNKGCTGITFEENNTLIIGKNIRAIEIYFKDNYEIDKEKWAAVDTKNRVYTPNRILEPNSNKENETPGGLKVNKHKKYYL